MADEVSESDKAVAKAAAAAFGGRASVNRWYDVDETHWVSLLRCDDSPETGLVSYSTVTLHNAPNVVGDEDIRVELAGVAPAAVTGFPDALTWVALTIIKDHWIAAPGVVYPDGLRRLEISSSLPNLMLVEPIAWEEFDHLELASEGTVHWLQAVPLSESEYQFLLTNGYWELQERLQSAGVSYVDFERASVV